MTCLLWADLSANYSLAGGGRYLSGGGFFFFFLMMRRVDMV